MRLLIAGSGALCVALGVLVAAQAQQTANQAPVRADAAISGVVIDGVTKQPIPDVVVQLGWPRQRAAREPSLNQFTDSKGRFVFTDLPAGADYSVMATKSGYFNNTFGSVDHLNYTARAIQLADGQWLSSANVTLWPPASISGTVFDERGEPVIGVFVRLLAQVRVGAAERWAVSQLTLTDDRGMYRIGQLHPGRYFVMVPSVQASISPSATSPSVIGLSQADLTNMQSGGQPQLFSRPALVDVDATIRIVPVPGYPVPPPPSSGRQMTYPIAFAGAPSLAQATPIVVEAGDDRTGVDVRLEPMPGSRVSGMVEGPLAARGNLYLRLVPEGLEDLASGSEAGSVLTGPDGSFTFANVPAGNYTIDTASARTEYLIGSMGIFYVPRAPRLLGDFGGATGGNLDSVSGFGFAASTPAPSVWARVPISARGLEETGVVVTLQPTLRMSGRLVGEPASNLPEPASPPRFVSLQSATGSPWPGSPRSSSTRNVAPGEFAIEGIVPGLYVLRTEDATWMLKSAIVNGRDYTHTPIEISAGMSLSGVVLTFTNNLPSLGGAVSSDSGAPSAEAGVIAFPAEPEQWINYGMNPQRIATVQASTSGAFRFGNLPAGSYYLVAVPATGMHAWRDPGFFRRAQPLATRITMDWGEQKTVSLKISNVR